MKAVARVFQSVTDFYNEINPATLSGAIDVVVIKQKDNSLRCSPFHVRFGKLQLLRAAEKQVELKVNEVVVDIPMKVGEAGEAFFVLKSEEPVPENLQTSPISKPTEQTIVF